jgi:glutathione S-transferase
VIDLYYRPGAASLAPHAALEELGLEFRLIAVTGHGDQIQPPGYPKLNPHRRVPTLVDGDRVVSESAAVLMYLADAHPEGGLAPADRTEWYRWLVYLTNTVQATFMVWIYPERYTADPEGIPGVKLQAERSLTTMRDFIEGELDGRETLLDRFSAADLYLFMLTRWGRNLDPKWWDQPNLGRHYRSVLARPAVARVAAREGVEF